ncbi:Selenide, water dikinase [Folsomia candida]|uniref:Selenide, water dikinase n=1 Tax=Folsomia candida TaxID=158441 RepID=A0A226EZ69_FOLCA|nr:Selenide, water dikinase [Folsomia candida]
MPLDLVSSVCALQFKWDAKNQRAIPQRSKIRRSLCQLGVAVHLMYTVAQYLFMLNSPYDAAQIAMALALCSVLSVALGLRFKLDLVPMGFINTLIAFESRFFKG